jgi:hypothetical protein
VRMADGMQLLAQILYPEVFDVEGGEMPHVLGDDYEQYLTP